MNGIRASKFFEFSSSTLALLINFCVYSPWLCWRAL